VAQAAFAVRWAANYGNGACDRSVYENYVWRNRVAPNQPSGGDDGYANKLGIGMEIVHLGDGSLLAPGVWELAAQINAAAMDVYSWPIARILDHRSSTRRKVDIRFKQKQDGYSINALRTRIIQIGAGGTTPPPGGVDDMWLPIPKGAGMGALTEWTSVVGYMQNLLNDQPKVSPKITSDGKYGDNTARALVQVFGGQGNQVNGNQMAVLTKESNGGGGGTPGPHTHGATTTIGASS
jgi:hypothetical protein